MRILLMMIMVAFIPLRVGLAAHPKVRVTGARAKVTVTVYQAVEGQTDESPNVTADGTIIYNEEEQRICAVSRDLLRSGVRYGSTVTVGGIEDCPELNGEWAVHDTMADWVENHVDLLVPMDGCIGKWEEVEVYYE